MRYKINSLLWIIDLQYEKINRENKSYAVLRISINLYPISELILFIILKQREYHRLKNPRY